MLKLQNSAALGVSIITAISTPALAEEIVLDDVIVSARGTQSTLSQTPGGIGIVDKDVIKLSPNESIADALSRIPGLSKNADSAWGAGINIRGMSGPSVIVLIDGVRLNTATEINARLGFINPMDVERIEVLKGPISALYGSGSTGGVVNIITKTGHYSTETQVNGEMITKLSSNPQGVDGYLRAGVNTENYWLQGSYGGRDHKDYDGGNDKDIPNSKFEDSYFRLAGRMLLNEQWEMNFQALHLTANEIGIPGGSPAMPQSAPITYPDTSNTMVNLGATYTPASDVLEQLDFSVYYGLNERHVRISNPNAMIAKITPNADHTTIGGKVQSVLNFDDHAVVAGIEASDWHMVSDRQRYLNNGTVRYDHPTPDTHQLTVGAYVEDNFPIAEEWSANLGGRLDYVRIKNNENNGANISVEAGTRSDVSWNAHGGLTWTASKNWSHTAIAATSYRTPDILDLFKDIRLAGRPVIGNPGLDPEKSYFFEYGAHYTDGPLKLSASAYYNTITDYITAKNLDGTKDRMENVGEVRIMGVELDTQFRFTDQLTGFANLALANGEDTKNDEPLAEIAPVNGNIGAKYAMENGFWLRAEMPWAWKQDEVPSGTDRTNGWVQVNAAAGYSFDIQNTKHELSLTLDNIFDNEHRNHLANSRNVELLDPGFNAALMYRIAF